MPQRAMKVKCSKAYKALITVPGLIKIMGIVFQKVSHHSSSFFISLFLALQTPKVNISKLRL